MQACFRDAHRDLPLQGVFTVMFTHNSVDAWDTLAAALIQAGFETTASWPVNTESDKSLHQAKKNAVQSTVRLACRKREANGRGVWFDDILGEVRQTARDKAIAFERVGLRGVDLYISTVGPALRHLVNTSPASCVTIVTSHAAHQPLAIHSRHRQPLPVLPIRSTIEATQWFPRPNKQDPTHTPRGTSATPVVHVYSTA